MATNHITKHLLLCLLSFLLLFTFPTQQSQLGQWRVLQQNIGISAMHMQLLHDNKVIMFDRTDFGPSNLSLPGGLCRVDRQDTALTHDCTAHSILYDIATNTFRPLMVQTDTWCSSGSVLSNGTLVQTGGYNDGDHVVRTFTPCNGDRCDWTEFPNSLATRRWYASNQLLPDGRTIIIGGRRQFSYEFYPKHPPTRIPFNFLSETTDRKNENNLYPFLHLLPNGNLFIFANTRSILFDYDQNRVVREFPRIPGQDPRNYPSTGSSVLLPLDENESPVVAEVLICGGAPRSSFPKVRRGVFVRAVSTCGRLRVGDQNPAWVMENLPSPRVMCDMIILPTGDVIIINGGEVGTAGWENGRVASSRPFIYHTSRQPDQRFSVLSPTRTARMYHSAAVLLPDGRVLVGGSNPHRYYNFTGVMYPTDLSLQAFSPPYLSKESESVRPKILLVSHETMAYQQAISIRFQSQATADQSTVSVRIIAPSFTTHSFAMNQRMVVLKRDGFVNEMAGTYTVNAIAPSKAEIAPSGYYLLFVVHAGVPSPGVWVRIQ